MVQQSGIAWSGTMRGLPDARARLTAIIEVLLCSSVPTQLAIGAILRLAGLASVDAAGHLSFGFVFILSLADTLLVIGLMIVFMRVHGERPGRLWIGDRPVTREVVIGLVTVPIIFVAVGILLNTLRLLMPWLHNVQTNPLEQLAGSPAQAAMFALVAIVAGGVREELQRAFMLHRFEQYLGGAAVGVIVTSIGFGFLHGVQGRDAMVTTAALGAFWAIVYLRRRNSIAPVVSHAGFNSLELLRVAMVGQ
jgi:membrane protease YdiL (CAAX protease family)